MANERNDDRNENQSGGSSYNAGNFKNNPQRASEAGRKGGQASRGRRS